MAANDRQGGRYSHGRSSAQFHRVCVWVLLVPSILAINLTPGWISSGSSMMPAGQPLAPNQPIQSVSIDSNGNLLVNGKPFLLIFGENMIYRNWAEAGYTLAHAEAKIQQMRSAGLKAVFAWDWTGVPEYGMADEVQAIWNRHRLYVAAPATLDTSRGLDAIKTYGTRDANVATTQIVNRKKTSPNVLMWWVLPEISTDGAGGAPWDRDKYAAAAALVRSLTHSVVYATVDGTTPLETTPWTNAAGAPLTDVPFFEIVVSTVPPGAALARLYGGGLVPGNAARAAGKQFVFGVSTTPLPEVSARWAENPTGITRLPSQAELDRFFLLQVAFNVRAFSVLWGPNERERALASNNGDAGVPPGYLDVWNRTVRTVAKLATLEPVILDPASFTSLVTTPAFSGPASGPYTGILARKKTVAGVTYVITINMNMVGDYIDAPAGRATVDVGFPIKSATRMFEPGSVQFSGRFITDSFGAMGVHVYAVR